MSNRNKEKISIDEEIRKLVIARLRLLSPDTMKSIGSMGTFTRDQLIKRVEKGDEVGETIKNIEMEWLRAQKEGIVEKLYE